MNPNIAPQALIVPLGLFAAYAVLIILVVIRRGFRSAESAVFALYLLLAMVFFLCDAAEGLRAIFPEAAWERMAIYVLLVLGIGLWLFARAFLQKPLFLTAAWIPAILLFMATALIEMGVITPPAFSLPIGQATITHETLTPAFCARLTVIAHVLLAFGTALIEFVRRASPLHRNRIIYWLFFGATVTLGLALVLTGVTALWVLGVTIHWLGSWLGAYTVVQSHLPNIGTNIRRVLSYVVTVLFPAAIAVSMGMGVAYLMDLTGLFRVSPNEDYFFGALITGIVVFVLYRPLSNLTRWIADRILFGRGYGAEEVVGDYGEAIGQSIELDALTRAAMQIIDRVLGIDRGTLLVVEEKRTDEWRFRIVEGMNVPPGLPPLALKTGSPLLARLRMEDAPLFQYTVDVDTRYEQLAPQERAEWRDLGMEIFFPIKRSGELIGVLALGVRRRRRPYADTDIRLLAGLAGQTAIALENASLFDKVQRRANQLLLLNQIGRVITTALDMRPALQTIAERVESTFEVKAGYIFLLSGSADELGLQTTFGSAPAIVDELIVPKGISVAGWVLAAQKPVLITNLQRDERYDPVIDGRLAPDGQVAMAVPVLSRNRAIGVILLIDPAEKNQSLMELNLLDSIGAFASVAIENAQQVALREAKLRRRIEELEIRVDETKREREVFAITESQYFRQLRQKADALRRRTEPGVDEEDED